MSAGECVTCGAELVPGADFCEGCGAGIVLAVTTRSAHRCHGCGAPVAAIGADGYCSICGVRDRGAGGRVELNLGAAAAVSDRGRVYRRNDDAFHLAMIDDAAIAVVCDGVSSSQSADLAARWAAAAVAAVLIDAATRRDGIPDATGRAMTAAQRGMAGLGLSLAGDTSDPACTIVSATCLDGELTIGWLGDSRAYWIGEDEQELLTADNSWAYEQVAAGVMSAAQASADPRAHSITRWLGADAPEHPPQIVTRRPAGPGLLVLCSDGLWNYAPGADDVTGLIRSLPDAASPLAVGRALTDAALDGGGHDNITVAVIDVRPTGR